MTDPVYLITEQMINKKLIEIETSYDAVDLFFDGGLHIAIEACSCCGVKVKKINGNECGAV